MLELNNIPDRKHHQPYQEIAERDLVEIEEDFTPMSPQQMRTKAKQIANMDDADKFL